MITIRRARLSDSVPIAAVHVAAWRSTYPGILPDGYLARLSVPRQAGHYERAIRAGVGVHVATASGIDLGADVGPPRVVGFSTCGPTRTPQSAELLGQGEIETLYVLDDWRDRGIGRRLMRAAAGHLAAIGCASAFLWVLRENPNRWFYERLHGKPTMESLVEVGGQAVPQVAYAWAPLEKLVQATQATP
ncbi:MAG: GNAT family N-acetyltransferase [Alphaproteobacteria bacterium]|jgi:ribosomal protein S18 acetylase RimI-like enzyme|nr:GNAT family N-acetyltransferase [Alphaproteobacteria bacterium]